MPKREETLSHGVRGPWTPLQIKFVTAYFDSEMNGAMALKAAGSKSKTPDVAAAALMKLPHIRRAIDKAFMRALPEAKDGLHRKLIERWEIQAFADRSTIYNEDTFQVKPLKEWTPEQRLLLESVSFQTNAAGDVIPSPKLASQEKALASLARASGVIGGGGEDGEIDFEVQVSTVKQKVEKMRSTVTAALAKARIKVKPE